MRRPVRLLCILSSALCVWSAAEAAAPKIEKVSVNGELRWEKRDGKIVIDRLEGRPGELVVIEGRGFGDDACTNFSQVTINRAAPLKRDIQFHRHRINPAGLKQYADYNTVQETEKKELLGWSDTRIEFRIPLYATTGDLVVTVQDVTGIRKSFVDGKDLTYDPEYVVHGNPGQEDKQRMTVRELGLPVDSQPIRFQVLGQEENIRKGREIFYYWPQYSNLAYALMDGRLDKLLDGTFRDIDGSAVRLDDLGWFHYPTRGPNARPYKGRINPSVGPALPDKPIEFANAYRSILFPLLASGPDVLPRMTIKSEATDWVGIVETEFNNALNGDIAKAPGITCATCHVARIETNRGPNGARIYELVPSIPNVKIDFHRAFQHIRPNLAGGLDRRRIVAAYGPGMLDFSSAHEDDGIFNPVAIGNHFGREALQRLSTAGLEGSIHHRNNMAYIHHGGIGRPTLGQSVALQAYINSTQSEGETLRTIGLFNYVAEERSELASGDLAALLATPADRYKEKFSKLAEALDAGNKVFRKNCIQCHTPSLGLYTSQRIIPLTQIGTYLPPSDRMLKTQGIRVAPLTQIYFRGQGGFLHDDHIKSLDDLFNPQRGDTGSPLYAKYYGITEITRRIKATTPAQVKALEKLNYFSETPASTPEVRERVYDYGLLRKTFGTAEYGKRIELPEVPHPYYVADPEERKALVLFLNSL